MSQLRSWARKEFHKRGPSAAKVRWHDWIPTVGSWLCSWQNSRWHTACTLFCLGRLSLLFSDER